MSGNVSTGLAGLSTKKKVSIGIVLAIVVIGLIANVAS